MIVSASRRADIPAHYAGWFMQRLRAGWCAVPNPFNARQVSRVSLARADVDAVVFWTRDPRPMLAHLPELEASGLDFVFQFTVVEYPPALHPGMPPLGARLEAFRRLARAIGPDRVLWRYDPVVLTQATPPEFHVRWFETLCRELAGATRRVTVSLVEPYRKTLTRLKRAGADLLAPREDDLAAMFRAMARTARASGMEPLGCADEAALESLGFSPGACVDAKLLADLFGIRPPQGKDASQRPACRCAPSRDIGMYDACPAGCAYCYATSRLDRARGLHQAHDPLSPTLLPCPAAVQDDQHRLPLG